MAVIEIQRGYNNSHKKHINEILKFHAERDWKTFHSPKNLAISLCLEAAEALEVFQREMTITYLILKRTN